MRVTLAQRLLGETKIQVHLQEWLLMLQPSVEVHLRPICIVPSVLQRDHQCQPRLRSDLVTLQALTMRRAASTLLVLPSSSKAVHLRTSFKRQLIPARCDRRNPRLHILPIHLDILPHRPLDRISQASSTDLLISLPPTIHQSPKATCRHRPCNPTTCL